VDFRHQPAEGTVRLHSISGATSELIHMIGYNSLVLYLNPSDDNFSNPKHAQSNYAALLPSLYQ